MEYNSLINFYGVENCIVTSSPQFSFFSNRSLDYYRYTEALAKNQIVSHTHFCKNNFKYDAPDMLNEYNLNINKILGTIFTQNQIIDFLEDEKYKNIEDYDEKQKAILNDIKQQVENLSSTKSKPLKINPGDWITTVKEYAIEHGKDNLRNRYKILSKTVRASDVYSEGNSLSEYGYSPDDSQPLTESSNNKKYITVFHGTQPKFVEEIKKEGLVDKTGNYSQGWYMVSTGFNSALFHANPDEIQKDKIYVFEFKIPYDDSNYWVGYPYLWKAADMNEDGTKWFALMKPIPSKFISRVIQVPYQDWINQKQKGLY